MFSIRFPVAILLWSSQLVYAQTGYVYQLDTEYAGANFFNGWDFYSSGDPTGGFVTYYPQQAAQLTGLINASANAPTYMGVDYTNVMPSYFLNNAVSYGAGRPSVRISTLKSWTHGLFIGDFAHAPGGICGTWPAWWTLAPNWPNNGEIDILEGVNLLTQNAMSLHTSPPCSIAGDTTTETGIIQGTDCGIYGSDGNSQGCGVVDSRNSSYGTGFNAGGGGVYAMQWTSQYIRVWFFPRNAIPSDITNLTPNPSNWGLPAANLQGSCTIDQHFQGHQIIFDNTFCGQYAGNPAVWNSTVNSCATITNYTTCNAFVAADPRAFQNSYWMVNSVRVYQLVTNNSSTNSTPYIASLQPTSTTATTSSTTAPSPTGSYCPTYNFTIVQAGPSYYEIICGLNYPGGDLGPPPGYHASTFEQCVNLCNVWNSQMGANYCVGVAWTGTACYPKNSQRTPAPYQAGYASARIIYYGYPLISDNPNSTTTSSTTTYISTVLMPQIYSSPNATGLQTQTSLSSASAQSGVGGIGMGGSGTVTQSTFIGAVNTTTSSAAPTMGLSLTSSSVVASTNSSSLVASSPSAAVTTGTAPSTSSTTTIAQTSSSTTSTSSTTVTSLQQSSSFASSSTPSSTIIANNPTATTTLIQQSTSTQTSIAQISITTSVFSSTSVSSMLSSLTFTVTLSSLSPTTTSTTTPLISSTTSIAVSTQISSTTTTSSSTQSSSSPTTVNVPPPPSSSIPLSTSSAILSATTVLPSGTTTTTISFTSSTPTLSTTGSPALVDDYSLLGCFAQPAASSSSFRLAEDSQSMSIEQCVADCYGSAYAGLYSTSCYCGDQVDALDGFTQSPDGLCTVPCPGDESESCGGSVVGENENEGGGVGKRVEEIAGMGKRQQAGGAGQVVLLTVYENDSLVPGGGGVGVTSSTPGGAGGGGTTTPPMPVSSSLGSVPMSSAPSTTSSAPGGGGFTIGDAPGAGGSDPLTTASVITLSPSPANLLPFVVSTVWIDICSTAPQTTTELTTTVTVLHCGCTASADAANSLEPIAPPAVPMTTTVKQCACGENGASSRTMITLPCASAIAQAQSSVASASASYAAAGAGGTVTMTAAAAAAVGTAQGEEGSPATPPSASASAHAGVGVEAIHVTSVTVAIDRGATQTVTLLHGALAGTVSTAAERVGGENVSRTGTETGTGHPTIYAARPGATTSRSDAVGMEGLFGMGLRLKGLVQAGLGVVAVGLVWEAVFSW